MNGRSDPALGGTSEKYWRVEHAKRVAFLVDSAAYFSALYHTLQRATRSILVVGWEFDPHVKLLRDSEAGELPVELASFLGALLDRRPSLEIRVLPWDYTPTALGERVLAPLFAWTWPEHKRFFFHPDGLHAIAASHHQKIIVVDDSLAFCGGMDLTWQRWDTPEHRAHDPRRQDHRGQPYGPCHDVHMAVDGDAAVALGDLVRERWRRATGEKLSRGSRVPGGELWPEEVDVDLRNVPVGISRTEAAVDRYPAVREIERVYLDAIATARRFIYVENQYLTGFDIGQALAARLEQKDGPEIVIVAPEKAQGWLEEGLMSALRVRLLNRLERADRYNRLRVYCPVVPNLDGAHVGLHSKVLIVDGTLVSVGSANVSNRSMTLDTECNLTLEAGRSRRRAKGIGRFLYRLLAEHVGSSMEEIERTFEKNRSLIATIDQLSHPGRNLSPLATEFPEWIQRIAPASSLSDPEGPMNVKRVREAAIPRRLSELTNHPMLKLMALAGLSVAAVGSWLWVKQEK